MNVDLKFTINFTEYQFFRNIKSWAGILDLLYDLKKILIDNFDNPGE
ncbi:hypothetical protein LCGC14_2599010 [marine sediment metagenome]|uniref:Uncharacterized protein n=1 Tax=marine sediment metagenome TaxID=412755 RepID=A0A0F9AX40_9ZZZZ